MITDSIDIVNFEDTKCETQECKKCGAGNVVNGAAWQDAVRQLPGFTENVDGASFAPFQYFARRLLTQLKPKYKQRLHDFISEHFGTTPVIGVHHRHGNGELDDFIDRKTGARGARLNKNNSQVIDWIIRSMDALQRDHGFDGNYKVFFATDSPEMTRLYEARDKRVIVFDKKEKEENEGKGFMMPGWQGWGRSPGTSSEYKSEHCETETVRAFLDMALLGYTDLLIVSKKSTFTFFPSLMMAARGKPVCGRRGASVAPRLATMRGASSPSASPAASRYAKKTPTPRTPQTRTLALCQSASQSRRQIAFRLCAGPLPWSSISLSSISNLLQHPEAETLKRLQNMAR